MKTGARKPRILLACKNRNRGGGQEKHFIQIARYLSRDYDLAFLIAGGFVEPDMPGLGRIYRFPGRGKWLFSPVDFLYMVYVLLRHGSDILHTHQRYPAFLGRFATRLLGRKMLCTVHNAFPDKSAISLWGDRMIAVSQGVKNWLVGTCGQDDALVTVIHNGIARPVPWPDVRLDELRKELQVPADTLVLFTAGRLSAQKNHAAMLRILARLSSSRWMLLVAGEGENMDDLIRQCAALGLADKVQFLGFRQDIEGLMQLADVFVMTSAWEGLPYVLVEALANGLPAIVTDVGGVAEAIRHDSTGFIVAAGDESRFVEKLDELLANESLRHEMSAECVQWFEQHFLDQAMFDSIEREYKILLTR